MRMAKLNYIRLHLEWIDVFPNVLNPGTGMRLWGIIYLLAHV